MPSRGLLFSQLAGDVLPERVRNPSGDHVDGCGPDLKLADELVKAVELDRVGFSVSGFDRDIRPDFGDLDLCRPGCDPDKVEVDNPDLRGVDCVHPDRELERQSPDKCVEMPIGDHFRVRLTVQVLPFPVRNGCGLSGEEVFPDL